MLKKDKYAEMASEDLAAIFAASIETAINVAGAMNEQAGRKNTPANITGFITLHVAQGVRSVFGYIEKEDRKQSKP